MKASHSLLAAGAMMVLLSASAWAAPKLIVVAPGETFTEGAGLSGSPDDQIAG